MATDMKFPIARDFMTQKLFTLHPDMDMFEAIDLLLKHKISGAPVLNNDGKIVGILSEKDSLKTFTTKLYHGAPFGKVREYMTQDVFSIDPDMGLFSVASLFIEKTIRRLPVVENNRLIGQVSRRDVLLVIRKLHNR